MDGKDYTKYDVTVAGTTSAGLSKQTAIKAMVVGLSGSGLPRATIQGATAPKRWHAVQPLEGETVQAAFERQFPDRGTGHWFDLGISDEQGCWVMPRLGGTKAERYLSDLVAAAQGQVSASWSVAAADAA